MTHAIETDHLTRTFGAITAVANLSLSVEEGEVFGILGPNGAGKTTVVRLMNGILSPSQGKLWVYGKDPVSDGPEVRSMTGVLTESPSHYERLTARQNLTFYATMSGVAEEKLPNRVWEMLQLFGLEKRADDLVGGFSKGMKQRLALARALVHEPKVLFLDEPTAGLDPGAAKQVDDLIAELSRQEGRTVFLCTHNLHEAQLLCDRVAMLNQGRLLAMGTIQELTSRIWQVMSVDVDLLTPLPSDVLEHLKGLEGIAIESAAPLHLILRVRQRDLIPMVVQEIVHGGGEIVRVSPREYSLEEVYFAIQKGDFT
ncbi:MAG: ABC transporter ATP-binding protein [Methanomicrobiales archaeon]|nr:ABC transporter ATP-binding protein [Methanomicrobiales archaeon]